MEKKGYFDDSLEGYEAEIEVEVTADEDEYWNLDADEQELEDIRWLNDMINENLESLNRREYELLEESLRIEVENMKTAIELMNEHFGEWSVLGGSELYGSALIRASVTNQFFISSNGNFGNVVTLGGGGEIIPSVGLNMKYTGLEDAIEEGGWSLNTMSINPSGNIPKIGAIGAEVILDGDAEDKIVGGSFTFSPVGMNKTLMNIPVNFNVEWNPTYTAIWGNYTDVDKLVEEYMEYLRPYEYQPLFPEEKYE